MTTEPRLGQPRTCHGLVTSRCQSPPCCQPATQGVARVPGWVQFSAAPRSRDRDPLPSRALRTWHILPHPPSPPLPLLLAPCQPAPNTVPPAGCSPTRDKPARSPLLSYLPTEGPPCRCPAHLSAPRSPRTTVPSGCVNTLRPPLHGIWVPPVPRVWPARAVPRHLSLPSRDPGVQGEKDAGWPGTPGPSGFNSGHPDVDTAGPTQPLGHVLTQRARLNRLSPKRKRQALLFPPTIHCSSL